MPGFLVGTNILMWFVLMLWVHVHSPSWFFVPFFVITTFFYVKVYLKMMYPEDF